MCVCEWGVGQGSPGCVCVVNVIVKHPALPLYAVDRCSRNPLYHYYVSMTAAQQPGDR